MNSNFSDKALSRVQAMLEEEFEFTEHAYDFTRCVTPKGEVYGTKGRCQPPNKLAPKQESPDKFKDVNRVATPILPKDHPMHNASVGQNAVQQGKILKDLRALREAKKNDPKGWNAEKAIREAEKIGGLGGLLRDPKSREEAIERVKRFMGF